MTITYDVLVPKPDTRPATTILPGSGIVAAQEQTVPDRTLVYFEGNKYGSAGMENYDQRVLHAAGRLHKRYPTIAFGSYPTADFDVVGTFVFSDDWRSHSLFITDQARVNRWTGDDATPLPPDPEGMNDQRSDYADLAIAAFIAETQCDHENALADLLTNLMHWADRHETVFDDELARGRGHYVAETAGTPVETKAEQPWYIITCRLAFDDEDTLVVTQAENVDAALAHADAELRKEDPPEETPDVREFVVNYIVESLSKPTITQAPQ